MALFQKSVLKSQLEKLDEDLIQQSWETYKSYFLDVSKQKIIFEKKEEELQYEFLLQLFDKSLGYDIGVGNQNLFVEQKNQTDSKKADGAIKINGEIVCVIELKSTKTKNLKDVEKQAFSYKVSHPNCKYVVTSNFNKLRFYIDNTTDFEEFDLFNLTNDRFKLLWLCLSYDSIYSNKPLDINKESLVNEEKITKQLYKDYSEFRLNLFADLKGNNPQVTPEILLQKTQKLLDRMLFILFCEDRGLLPSNSITEIINYWDNKKEFGDDETLYDTYVTYFNVINKGRPQRGNKEAIYAYNGGLFIDDEVLDNLVISDDLLLEYSKKLTAYDFESEVSVNILGHIFEHSLTEIEELQNEIDGFEVDKSKSKRKKEGVYYTPQYITKYIVENTIGKLCEEKKIELKINEGEYLKGRKGRPKKKLQSLIDLLSSYRNWLLQITICDPACGSGAFLNQALEFLITEHQYIDELQSSLLEEQIQFSEVENSILENNLYGVDINRESVEIAKLSLWLRTAQKGRKLTSLNNNIKCGNSLIDDPEVAGEKAFNWQKEFPDILKMGGFDVIVGNPPYVSNWTLSSTKRNEVEWLSNYYKKDLTGHWDLFICFISSSLKLLKMKGYNSFILPTSFLKEKYGRLIRERIITELELIEIIDFGEKIIFENVARQTFIYNLKNIQNPNNIVAIKKGLDKYAEHIPQIFFKQLKNCSFKTNVTELDTSIYNKLNESALKVGELYCINVGVVAHSKKGSPLQFKKDDVIKEEFFEGFKKYVIGSDFRRYSIIHNNLFIDYDSKKEYFHRPKFPLLFESNKIMVRRTSGANNSIIAYYDKNKLYTNDSIMHMVRWTDEILEFQNPDKKWNINKEYPLNDYFVLAIISSKLSSYYFSKFLSTDTLQGSYSSIYPEDLRDLPIINVEANKQKPIVKLSELHQNLNLKLNELMNQFIGYLSLEYNIQNFSKKLLNWHQLEFGAFTLEFNKTLKKEGRDLLDDKAKFSFMSLFETQKGKVEKLKTEIDKTDKEIDQMVYELYGLTKEEIEIVENATK